MKEIRKEVPKPQPDTRSPHALDRLTLQEDSAIDSPKQLLQRQQLVWGSAQTPVTDVGEGREQCNPFHTTGVTVSRSKDTVTRTEDHGVNTLSQNKFIAGADGVVSNVILSETTETNINVIATDNGHNTTRQFPHPTRTVLSQCMNAIRSPTPPKRNKRRSIQISLRTTISTTVKRHKTRCSPITIPGTPPAPYPPKHSNKNPKDTEQELEDIDLYYKALGKFRI